MTIVCGDSHTSTHGAFGNIAFGIGTSEVEQVLATQCILQYKPKTMKIEINGTLGKGGGSVKILFCMSFSKISAQWCHWLFLLSIRATPSAIFPWKARMTICNMSIEMGAARGRINRTR